MKLSQCATFSAAYVRSCWSFPFSATFSGTPHSSRNRRLYDSTRPSGSITSTPSGIASCCALRMAIVVRLEDKTPKRETLSQRAKALFALASLDDLRGGNSGTWRLIRTNKRFILDEFPPIYPEGCRKSGKIAIEGSSTGRTIGGGGQ